MTRPLWKIHKQRGNVMGRQKKEKTGKSTPTKETATKKETASKSASSIAEERFEEGKKKISELETEIQVCANKLVRKVQRRPLSALLIAGGVGFILSSLLRK